MTARTLIIGLGNPLLGDDGVGWRVVEEVQKQIGSNASAFSNPTEVDCHAGGGLSLMERLVGYDRAVIVDALCSGRPPGEVSRSRLEDLPDFSSAHTGAAHDTSLQNALRLGRMIGAHLPEDIIVIGVEALSVYDFSETLSPPVARAVPVAVRRVLDLLEEACHDLA